MTNEKSFTFIEIAFVKTLVTIKNNISFGQIMSCALITIVGFICAMVIGNIIKKILEVILRIDKDTYKKRCEIVMYKNKTFYIPKGRCSRLFTHSRIMLVSRVVKLIIITLTIHGCALAFINSIGGVNISIFGFILIATSTIKSSLGAGVWILTNNEIQRGNIIYFNNDKKTFLQIKDIGWMHVICNDVTEVVQHILQRDIESGWNGVICAVKQLSIPNTHFMSCRRGFFWKYKRVCSTYESNNCDCYKIE